MVIPVLSTGVATDTQQLPLRGEDMADFVITAPVQYRFNGWSVHSGAGINGDRWWLACYVMGAQVATYPKTFPLSQRQDAQERANELNSKGWTLS